ncbi:5929_t:CDS:2 [Ambispora gerdemannii]|uniref:5929_t:CDS:1 n=1 Tax=Ambispora gerdemannii TaxID=144530 RepID=A0A9N8YIZ1_9GLOM|nr:5929_t:CDS:2 [Ambispora gerdemannii]
MKPIKLPKTKTPKKQTPEKNMRIRILSIDPSGTGTSGIFLVDIHHEDNSTISYEFQEFKNTTYIYGRQQKGTVGLCKLLGGITSLEYIFTSLRQIGSVPVNVVKSFRDKVQTGTEEITGLSFEVGREHLKSSEEIERKIAQLKAKKRLGVRQQEHLTKLEASLGEKSHRE